MTGIATEWKRAAVLAALVVIAMGANVVVAGAPVPLLPGEAALVRGGAAESGDCNVEQKTLDACFSPLACNNSVKTNCDGSCANACEEAGAWTDDYGNGIQKKADTDCGNQRNGATCTKTTPKNGDPYCSCTGGMDSGAVGTCGVKKGLKSCG